MSTEPESLLVPLEPAQSKFASFHHGIQVSKAHPHWKAAWMEAYSMGLVGRAEGRKFLFNNYTIEKAERDLP